MKSFFQNSRIPIFLQVALIYIWLSILSPLAGTEQYYSVYLLCAVAGLGCLFSNANQKIPLERRQTCWLGAFSALFSLAVLLANYPLFEPLSTLQNGMNVTLCFFGGGVLAWQVLLCLMQGLPFASVTEERRHPARFFGVVFAVIAIIDLGYLFFARYPGVLTTDSVSTISQILGQTPYNNVMPYYHTRLVEIFIRLGMGILGDINAGVALFHCFQIFWMAACFAFALTTLYQAGVPRWMLLGIFGVYALLPYNIVYSVTLWKDVPFGGAVLLFVTSLYRVLGPLGSSRRLNLCLLALGALGMSLLRTNGWLAFAVTTGILGVILYKEHRKTLAVLLGVLIASWVLLNPVLDILNVEKTDVSEAFAVPMQQIARVVANDRELTGEEQALLEEIFWMDKLGKVYDPLTVDPVKFEAFRGDRKAFIRENWMDYGRLYLSLGMKYPGDYLRAWIDETKGYWNGGYSFWIYTLGTDGADLGIFHSGGENAVAKCYAALFRYLEKPIFLQSLYSIGLHVWVLIAICLVGALKRRREILVAVPMLILMAGLWFASPVYAEFRYAYPMMISLPVILSAGLYGNRTA